MKLSSGSLFSTSEGWFTMVTAYLMSDVISDSSDWRVSAAGALALAIVVTTYIVMRSKIKMSVDAE
jgi:hypothetical protein